MQYTIFTDGGARGNPGNAAVGIVIQKNKEVIYEIGKYIGFSTNNIAEYTAVKEAFNYLISTNQERGEIQFFLDSELVVKQLTGVYKIKDTNLQRLALGIQQNIKVWGSAVSFSHIRRENNKRADLLVNDALNKHLSTLAP